MTMRTILFCCLAVFVAVTKAVPLAEGKEVLKDEVEHHMVPEMENKVQPPAAIERIDADLPLSDNKESEKVEKEDLETANTYWGGYYRTPVWGWGRSWGYPTYRSYGWGGRGYNGWGSGYRGWNNGYYWR